MTSVFENSLQKYSVLVLAFICHNTISCAQKNVQHQEQIWHGVYVNLPINKRLQIGSEIQERHFVLPFKQQQFLIRNQVFYNVSKDAKVIFGSSHFKHGPSSPSAKNGLTIPEWRLELGCSNRQVFKHFVVQHRYRWESRFYKHVDNNQLSKQYIFSHFRFRYQLGIDVPLIKSDDLPFLSLKLREEIMFNIGESILYNVFDQNRLSMGLYVLLNKHLGLETTYLNLYQQQAKGRDFINRNILRFSFYYNI